MPIKEEKSITEIIERLKEDYYIYDFEIQDNKLTAKDLDTFYNANDVVIDKVFRFEGTSDPADMSIIYAVTTNDGKKGIIINAFGTYGDGGVDEFMKGVKYPNKTDNC
jgi:hypothetical protein